MSNIHIPKTRNGGTFTDAENVKLHSNDFEIEAKIEELSSEERRLVKCYQQLCHDVLSAKRQVGDTKSEKTVNVADKPWELHYGSNRHHFPLKNYIIHAFPVLVKYLNGDHPSPCILECGCGTGSTLLPLMRQCDSDTAIFAGFDISKSAIRYFSEHTIAANYLQKGRLFLFQFDMSTEGENSSNTHGSDGEESSVKKNRIEDSVYKGVSLVTAINQQCPSLNDKKWDVVLLVFVLSALPSFSLMVAGLKQLRGVIKSDGLLLFRDYALPDHSFFRYTKKTNGVVSCPFIKGDGTTQFFFERVFIKELFESAGFIECTEENQILQYHCNRIVNRKNGKRMDKIFLNGCFRLKPL